MTQGVPRNCSQRKCAQQLNTKTEFTCNYSTRVDALPSDLQFRRGSGDSRSGIGHSTRVCVIEAEPVLAAIPLLRGPEAARSLLVCSGRWATASCSSRGRRAASRRDCRNSQRLLKGTVQRDFLSPIFSRMESSQAPYTVFKDFSNLASNSVRYSRFLIDSPQYFIAESPYSPYCLLRRVVTLRIILAGSHHLLELSA
jgi:hypothetical protein